MTGQANALGLEFTVFMLVRTAPEWPNLTIARRRELAQAKLTPILKKHQLHVSLHFFDLEMRSARVMDIWIWRARDAHGYHHLMEDLRKSQFWRRLFCVVEVLAGVDEAQGRQYYRELVSTWDDCGFVDAKKIPLMQDVA